jgi:hypothetical protein
MITETDTVKNTEVQRQNPLGLKRYITLSFTSATQSRLSFTIAKLSAFRVMPTPA